MLDKLDAYNIGHNRPDSPPGTLIWHASNYKVHPAVHSQKMTANDIFIPSILGTLRCVNKRQN